MPKRKSFLILITILLLAFVAGNLSYPDPLNNGIDFLNSRLRQGFGEQVKFSLPHFWNIPFRLGLDLQGGTHLIYQADLSGIDGADHKNALDGLRDVIERRVNLFGVSEPVIQIEEQSQRLIVELAGVKDVKEAISMIGQTPFLEFKEQKPDEEFNMILQKQQELEGMTFEEVQSVPDWQIALDDPFTSTQLTGRYLKKAELIFEPTTNKPMVSIQFDDEGAKLFEELTTRNIGKSVAIYIDNTLISSPIVQESISGGKA